MIFNCIDTLHLFIARITHLMTVQMLIDMREHAILDHLASNPTLAADHTTCPLAVGDIQIKANDTIVCIMERKTLTDLVGSIKDGRYREQKLRLLQAREESGCHIVYIIESSPKSGMQLGGFNEMPPGVMGAILNTCFRDLILVLQSNSVLDTVALIQNIHARFVKDPAAYTTQNHFVDMDDEHKKSAHTDALIKTQRKGNIDADTCFLMQLACIPGISHKKALAIAEHFECKNMGKLVSKFVSTNEKDGIKRLCEVEGLGKILAKSVFQHLACIQ